MFEIKTDSSIPVSEIKLTGAITIQNSAEVKELLLENYKKTGNLVIDMSGVENIDLTYLQTLISLKRTMQAEGKSLKFYGINTPAFMSLIADAGYAGYEWLTGEIDNNPEGKMK